MSKHDDGGPAFPIAPNIHANPGDFVCAPVHSGMSLLDWFAGQALMGLLAAKYSERQLGTRDVGEGVAKIVVASHVYAEAMLAEMRWREAAKETNDEAETE